MSYIGAKPQTAEFYYDVFNGDGVTETFTTTISPGTPVSVIVIVNDSILDPQDYYFVGNQIEFVTAPPTGTRNIQLRYLSVPVSGQAAPSTFRNVNEYYATQGQTVFYVSYYDLEWIDVYVNGTQLGNDDFQALDSQTVVLQRPCNEQDLVRVVSAYTTVLARARDPQMNFAYGQANNSLTLAQAAFNFANTSALLDNGINITQNTNIVFVDTKAQAAFDKANTIASGGTAVDQFARDRANLSLLIDATQNTNIVFVDTKAQAAFDKANTGSIDQFARDTANATVLLQSGINATQNANIVFVDTKAQAAFDKANTGTSADQFARNTANLSLAIDATQNTNITAINTYVQSAYNQANTGTVLAQAAFNYANTLISSGSAIDQFARNTANATILLQSGINATQNSNIDSANSAAQSALNSVNSLISLQSGINATQNTNNLNVSIRAQAAFDAANTKLSAVTGTTNQVVVTGSTLSLPQSIATTSTVQFGSFGVGTTPSGTSGEIRATNNITAYYSDDKLKTRLGTIENALEKVKSLTGFYYEANQTAQDLGYTVKREVGLSAQEVQKILPEIVVPAPIDEKYLTIYYEKLVPLLVEAIKDLSKRVDDLEKQDSDF